MYATLLLAGCSSNPSDYVSRGNRLAESGNLSDAALNYRKAIQRDVRYFEAHYRLGLVQARMGEGPEAYGSLQEAVRLKPDDEASKVALADLCLVSYTAGDGSRLLYDQTAKLADAILKANPASASGLRIKGALALLDRNPQTAVTMLGRARDIAPNDQQAMLLLVQAMYQAGDTAAAEKLEQEMIRTHPGFGPAYDAAADRLRAKGQLKEAEDLLKSAVEKNPADARRRLMLAAHYYGSGQFEEMRRVADEAIRLPKPGGAALAAGDFYAGRKLWDEARKCYELGMKQEPNSKVLYMRRLLRTHLESGNEAAVTASIKAILAEDPGNVEIHLIRVRRELLQAQREAESGNPERLQAAVRDLESLAKKNPGNAEVSAALGTVRKAQGNLDAAVASFLASIDADASGIGPRLELTEIYLLKDQPDKAAALTDEILQLQPANSQAKILRAAALSGAGQTGRARSELVAILEAEPNRRDARVQLANLDIQARRFAEADANLRRLQELDPDNQQAMVAFVKSKIAQKQTAIAIAFLREKTRQKPDSLVLRTLLGETAAIAGDHRLAIEQYEFAASKTNKAEAFVRLGEAFKGQGDLAKAIASFEKAKQIAPADRNVLLFLAVALKSAGRTEEAIRTYNELLTIAPDNPWALNNLAFLLADSGRDPEGALTAAQKAARLLPDQPAVQDTLGWALYKINRRDQAERIFERLVAGHPDNATYRYHLAMVLIGKGERARAKSELNAALSRRPAAEEEKKIRVALGQII